MSAQSAGAVRSRSGFSSSQVARTDHDFMPSSSAPQRHRFPVMQTVWRGITPIRERVPPLIHV
jgi:hypothetical protein